LRRGISGDTSSCSFNLGGDSVGGVKVVVVVSGCIGFVSWVFPHGKEKREQGEEVFLTEEKNMTKSWNWEGFKDREKGKGLE